MEYTDEECISALKKAKDRLGKSPSRRRYQKLDISPSAYTIAERFGSWNKAKERAGLKINQSNNRPSSKPENVTLSEDKKWEKISAYQRYYYKNRAQEIERTRKRKKNLRKWYKQYKSTLECEKCGEDNPVCLDFHHLGEKISNVSELVRNRTSSKIQIKKEIEKCKVLCANCHRKEHFKE